MKKLTKEVICGNIKIGGNNPITIQSMTNTDTKDVYSTVKQIKELEEIGCDIIRVAVPDMEAAQKLGEIKRSINIPLIADIHYDYRLALEAINQGIDGLRINPGNIGSLDRVREIVKKAKNRKIKIRVGVNGGSLEKDLIQKYGRPTPQALVESALRHVNLLESMDFDNIVISLKSSDIYTTIKAYEIMSQKVNYPLHIGITEAGSVKKGTVKSSIGIGYLLINGIGDTIRVSLTGDPKEEILIAREILKCLGIKKQGIQIISCPTCGRCNIDLIDIVSKVEERVENIDKNMTVAIMGCSVNGPGEAREADIGIAGGKNEGLFFRKGAIVRKIKAENMVKELIDEIIKF
ncbi:4-hydroxy-3-methylbut-2-en-1-yl diphosphate synthase [Alkalithermobacter thermoalcaliphilus JW-YL-7 = DSM 7308]|uniref:4-hydroxy-3-methylbut-2-en-1-yl diphosphate synthase (flavodoxin) n=1 Tax=Alkalithermobacter thermoalcaliphilus JW-YL-7 = DSM 7308 TaxID=1121328 RepID=A0A150FQF1_CLOPD|nr:4-hydroxy-3-methylbut-2-en-1-yl diphosphate synthase [[Clostridium] paradoxum JW-YL-7 = DSM 7308]SHK59752.1 4-hydroxy-3-methylbut-2-en-1-yl diphosphate synthase [[Clostridium] paradoxum JW-YL-7 = DSM 7308]